jgi:hypothetical protein
MKSSPFCRVPAIDTRSRPELFDQCTQGWFQTYTGGRFYPVAPRPEDVRIEDICHALSLFNRFGGHTKEFYSVAQHLVLTQDWLAEQGASKLVQLQGLMHDFTEAYCGDVVRPLKVQLLGFNDIEAELDKIIEAAGYQHSGAVQDTVRIIKQFLRGQLQGYKEIEARLSKVIHDALGVPEPEGTDADLIKLADNTILMTERRDLFLKQSDLGSWWVNEPAPWRCNITNWGPEVAEFELRFRYNTLREHVQPKSLSTLV